MISGIIKKLIDDADVQAIIGLNKKGTTRKIYPVRIEQEEEFPAVTVSLADASPAYVSKGCAVLQDKITIRVVVYSAEYYIIENFEIASKNCLDLWVGTSGNSTYEIVRYVSSNDVYDDAQQVYGRVIEFSGIVKR